MLIVVRAGFEPLCLIICIHVWPCGRVAVAPRCLPRAVSYHGAHVAMGPGVATVHAMGPGHGHGAYVSACTQGRPEVLIWFLSRRARSLDQKSLSGSFLIVWSGDEQVVGTLLSAFQDVTFKRVLVSRTDRTAGQHCTGPFGPATCRS